MANMKCPGRQTPRNLDSVIVKCPDCGRGVEFFTDEPRRHCRCGLVLFREAMPQCADWCPAAARCLGLAVDSRKTLDNVVEGKAGPDASKPSAGMHPDRIRKRSKRKKPEAGKA